MTEPRELTAQKLAASRYRLAQLDRWLSIEAYGPATVFLLFFVASGMLTTILSIVAVVFAPFMLWTLMQENRKGWFVAFFAINVPVYVIAQLIGGSGIVGVFTSFAPLVSFYAYCFLLRWAVAEWLRDIDATTAMTAASAEEEEFGIR